MIPAYLIPKDKLIEVSKLIEKVNNLGSMLPPPIGKPIQRKDFNS